MQRSSFSAFFFFDSLLIPSTFFFSFKASKRHFREKQQIPFKTLFHVFYCEPEKMLWKPYFGISTFGENNRKNKQRWKCQPHPKKSYWAVFGVHRRSQQGQSSKIQPEITKYYLEERKERIHACFKISLYLLVIKQKKKETLRKKKTVSFLVNGIFLLTSYWETWIYILPGGLHSHCG